MEKRTCPNCGAKLSKTARCCIECGEFLENLPGQPSTSRDTVARAQAEDINARIRRVLGTDKEKPIAPEQPAPAPAEDTTPNADTKTKAPAAKAKAKPVPYKSTLGIGLPATMGLQLLFFIPVVGLIAAIIFLACRKDRDALRLLAKARVAWTIAIAILCVVLVALYELWLRQFLLSHDILGVSVGGLKLYFSELTLTGLFG